MYFILLNTRCTRHMNQQQGQTFARLTVSRALLVIPPLNLNIPFFTSNHGGLILLWWLFADFFLEVFPAVGAGVQGGQAGHQSSCVVLRLLRRLFRVVRRGCVYLTTRQAARFGSFADVYPSDGMFCRLHVSFASREKKTKYSFRATLTYVGVSIVCLYVRWTICDP